MKIRAAVLEAMNAAPPYAESRPLRIQEVELDPPGPAKCSSGSQPPDCATRTFR
jgi:hypothetical protein